MSHQLAIQHHKNDNFGEWYKDLVTKCDLILYSKVSGCYAMRPNATFVWERVREYLDGYLQLMGVENCSFPLLIPKSVLSREEKHLEGFTPEVAWVTKAGSSELDEPLAIRPTSETVIYDLLPQMVKTMESTSFPLMLNQWCNVLRWEFNNPTPFIRSREFLWQEGHTSHLTDREAIETAEMMGIQYHNLFYHLLSVYTIPGVKTEKERFAGATETYTIEAWIPGGRRAIQAATSHFLGQRFSKIYDIYVQSEKMEKTYLWQTSWGVTTRSIGIALMTHSDDTGVVLPSTVCRYQLVIVPIFNSKNKNIVMDYVDQVADMLSDYRVTIDTCKRSPGWKYNYWEMRGVPLRIEVGGRDREKGVVTVAKRIKHTGDGEKSRRVEVPINDLSQLKTLLHSHDTTLYDQSKRQTLDAIKVVTQEPHDEEIARYLQNGNIVAGGWCLDNKCEGTIRNWCPGAKSLCIPHKSFVTEIKLPISDMKCLVCHKVTNTPCLFGRSL